MTQLPPRPALDQAEEELIALLREEIRSARKLGRRVVVVAEVTVHGRVIAGYVQPPRKALDVALPQA